MKRILLENDDLKISVKRDAAGKIISGIELGDTRFQEIDLVLRAAKGEFKESPALGVYPEKYLKSTGKVESLRREIALQLQAIGYDADVAVSETGEVIIDV